MDWLEKREREYEYYVRRCENDPFGMEPMDFKMFCHWVAEWERGYLVAWRQPDGPDWREIKKLEHRLCVCRRSGNGKEAGLTNEKANV